MSASIYAFRLSNIDACKPLFQHEKFVRIQLVQPTIYTLLLPPSTLATILMPKFPNLVATREIKGMLVEFHVLAVTKMESILIVGVFRSDF